MHFNSGKFRITTEFISIVQFTAQFQTEMSHKCPVNELKNKTNEQAENRSNPNESPKING